MSRTSESRYIFVIAAVLIFFTQAPYGYAQYSVGNDYVFGGLLINPQDGYSYLAKMYEGLQGAWTFTLPYTAEISKGTYLFLFYIFLGHLSRLLNLSLPLVFHMARFVATIFLLCSLNRFFKYYLPEKDNYIYALAISILGSGMGWLAILLGWFTADFWVAEIYPFLSAFANPHFPISMSLILLLFTPNQFLNFRGGYLIQGFLQTLITFLLGILSPFCVVVVILIVSSGSLSTYIIKKREINFANVWNNHQLLVWVCLGGIPILIYEYLVIRTDPLLSIWNAQNLTITPPVWDIVIACSPIIFLAIIGTWATIKFRIRGGYLSLFWVCVVLVLIYLPVNIQRRFLLGIYIPLVTLAIIGLDWVCSHKNSRDLNRAKFKLSFTIIFGISIVTNLIIMITSIFGVRSHNPLIYFSTDEYKAYKWLEAGTPSTSIILAGNETGLFIPAYSGRRVRYGHPYETINADIEKAKVENFFKHVNDISNENAMNFFLENNIDYIFYGPRERELNGDVDSKVLIPGANKIYHNQSVIIYQIK